jgi:hypothetical protein
MTFTLAAEGSTPFAWKLTAGTDPIPLQSTSKITKPLLSNSFDIAGSETLTAVTGL